MIDLQPGNPVPARPRRPVLVLRLALAVALLAYVVTRVDWSTVVGYRDTVSWPWLAAFVLLIPLGHVISSAKWRLLLRASGHEVGLWRLTGLYIVGQFYNVVLPSTIGGDVVRSLGLGRIIGDTRTAFASTVAERVTGAAVLVVLGVVATSLALPDLLTTRDGALDGRIAVLMVLGTIGGTTFAIVAILSTRVLALVRRTVPSMGPLPLWLDRLERFQKALNEYRRKPLVLGQAIGYSVLFNAVPLAMLYAGCRVPGASGATIGMFDALVMMPIILLLGLLPLTPGGYGVMQWAYMVTFAAWLGVEATEAATLGLFVSLIHAASNIVVAASGFAFYTALTAFGNHREPEP